MPQPEQLVWEDVRWFQGGQRGSVRPITLLVGENSTGKSTFLACFSILHQMLHPYRSRDEALPDFNQEPFSMGSFRDIVRSRQGPTGRINAFKLGISLPSHKQIRDMLPSEIVFTFEERGSQPVPKSCLYRFGPTEFINIRRNEEDYNAVVAIPDREVYIRLDPADFPIFLLGFEYLIFAEKWFSREFPNAEPITSYLHKLLNLSDSDKRKEHLSYHKYELLSSFATTIVPVAPLRAKPKRTYDPVSEVDSPGGEHIPMLMMRLDHVEKNRWQSLHDELVEFGKDSGLFSDIKVRRHGKQIHDPFQLQVKSQSGAYSNIMDVGYGVSQSLPILVELLSEDGRGSRSLKASRRYGKTFLLQQPEVHLHPKGQAELANLFAKVVNKKASCNRFLIETHSDYIVDRIRILVRKKQLKPEDVSIIFFEPKNNKVQMHNIVLDKFGNIENAPDSYRSFFLRETDRLLGLND
ncbi:MAG: AAA family ATPase [Gammaproteobacteria bacterium]|nr:AAA family ATPase [Gammaproteobacteria bacterium]